MLIVEAIGNIGGFVVKRQGRTGGFYSFSLAHNKKITTPQGEESKTTVWLSCTLNEHIGDKLKDYLTPGRKLFVRGGLECFPYVDGKGVTRVSLSVSVREIELCGGLLKTEENDQVQNTGNAQQSPEPDAPF